MQTRRSESPKSLETASPAKTATRMTVRRLERDLKNLDTRAARAPNAPPMTSERTISIRGSIKMALTVSSVPFARTFAIENDTENTISPIASSNATTGSNVFVTTPLA